jgi:hypothetical protein
MADEPKLVVALEARLDKFEKQLREAGLIAQKELERIETKTSQITIGTALGRTLSRAIESAMSAAIDEIKRVIDEMNSLNDVIRETGITAEQFQRIGFAAVSSGLGTKELLSGLSGISTKLDEINRRETELSKYLDANNVKYRDRNGLVVQAAKGFELAAERMAQAGSEAEKIEIARLFGVTKEWVKVLGQGVEKLREMQAAAKIDENFARMLKHMEAIQAMGARNRGEFLSWGSAITTSVLPALDTVMTAILSIANEMAHMFVGQGGAMETWSAAFVTRLANVVENIRKARSEAEGPLTQATIYGKSRNKQAPKDSGGEKDALTRQVEQLNKINALTEQELKTVGMTVAKQEESRQITLLNEAAKRAGLNAETAVTEQMKQQAAEAGKLKQLLVEREAQWRNMVSASQEFGSMMSDAMKGMVLEGKKFDEVLKNIGNRLASKAFDKLFDVMFASPSGGGGSMFMNLLGIKAKMAGGPVSGGSPYMVGERGPELFVPNRSGMIVPNTALGGAGGGISVGGSRTAINIQGSADRSTVAAMQEMLAVRDRRFIADVAGATRELRRRSVRT